MVAANTKQMEQIVNILKELPTLTEAVITSTSSDSEGTTTSSGNIEGKRTRRRKEVRLCGDMYEQWPALEFSDLNSSILDLFPKGTSQFVAAKLLEDLIRSDSDENGDLIRLGNDEYLKWIMQVINHSLTLSFATNREYDTLKGAVRIYLHWLRALCDTPDNNIPTPLLETPEKYFRNIIDALRWVFCRRDFEFDALMTSSHVPRGLAIERQSIEIEMVLDSLKYLTKNSSRKYHDEVWARSLSFLLNSADILLAEPNATEEMGTRICVRVADTLFDMWLNAVLNEHIPSLTYWSSLATLARRWRHNVPIIECWAKKILGLSVLVCRKMYGDDYLKVDILDDSVIPFGSVHHSHEDDENDVHLLYRTWFNMLCLFDSPAKILSHDAARNGSLNGNTPKRTVSSISASNHDLSSTLASQGVSFFLAATTLQRMVDLFYGDSRVSIDLRTAQMNDTKTPTNTRTASVITDSHSHQTNKTTSTAGDSSRFVSLGGAVGQILVDDTHIPGTDPSIHSGSQTSGRVSIATSGSHDLRREHQKTVHERSREASYRTASVTDSTLTGPQSRISEQTSSTITYKSAPPPEIGGSFTSESVSHVTANSTSSAPVAVDHRTGIHSIGQELLKKTSGGAVLRSEITTNEVCPQKHAQKFVTQFLAANPAVMPFVGNRKPKTDRMLSLMGEWLFAIANSPPSGLKMNGTHNNQMAKRNNDLVSDDVISGLSLHSVDLDDIPDAMSPMMGRSDSAGLSAGTAAHNALNRRKSVGSSCSSVAGESDVMSSTSTAGHSNKHSVDDYSSGQQIDGVTAGRAAALASLVRIICSKSSNEKIPNGQLANFYATVFQTLVEKDRVMLCTLFYYGRNLFRLGLPGIESLLPHFLFALDIVMIESSKLRLHPSISEVEIRRACLRALSSVICWPTTFGMSKIPQIAEASGLKSNAPTYLHLRSRIFKTLMFSVRNETDLTNLHIALGLCAVLVEESCQFDLGLNEEQTKEMIRISTTASSSGQPEKGLCASIVRGVLSAICDKLGRIETIDHSTALAIIDVLSCISHVNHTVLFNNMDVSTGTLVIASLCRFIEQQLNKPPPLHSKDLHSTVVAAFNAVAVWLTASPLLAECVGVLGTVCDVIQLGVTGTKSNPSDPSRKSEETVKPKPASQRVLEAAEALMYALFCVVGRHPDHLRDERRLLHTFGPSAIDTTKFLHVLVNGDTLLSLHEASHIPSISTESAAVLYVRRSPMQGANIGIAKLRSQPENYLPPDSSVPPITPMSAMSINTDAAFEADNPTNMSTCSLDASIGAFSAYSAHSKVSSVSKLTTRTAPSGLVSLVSPGSILTGVATPPLMGNSVFFEEPEDGDNDEQDDGPATPTRPQPQKSIGEQFVIPPEFYRNSCKLDSAFRNLESTAETEAIAEEMKLQNSQNGKTFFDEARRNNVFERMTKEERRITPLKPGNECSSIRLMLYDFGLINEKMFGSEIVVLDSLQSEKFYRDLHESVDCTPARTHQTAHIFYVKEGQRNAVDILENALNVQNTCSDFCMFLSNIGEGVEIGIHDTWTGHWSTAYSCERKPIVESEGVDHYIVDGIQHSLWWCDEQGGTAELAFLMPTERSVRIFKQNITSPASSSRRGSNNRSMISDDRSFDSSHTDNSGHLSARRAASEKSPSNLSDRDFRPYAGGGSSMGQNSISRRTNSLRIMLVWLERAEDMASFPIYELIGACDDGSDHLNASINGVKNGSTDGNSHHTPSPSQIAHHILFFHLVEPGIVEVRTRGTTNRFGEAGPLVDGVVVSLANLPSFVRNTILNSSKRDVAEIENYMFPHTRRKQAIVDFAKKYASAINYEEFLVNLIQN